MTAWQDVAALNDLDDEFGLGVKHDDVAVAIFRDGDPICAVEDFCPHQGSPLSGGLVRDGILTCPLHAWQFRLDDGKNVDSGPGIKAYPLRVVDGRIEVLL